MQEFLNRVRKNWKIKQKWAARSNLQVYRVYDKDLPQFPLVIDKLGPWLIVGSYARYPDTNELILSNWSQLADVFDLSPESLIFRERTRQKGSSQYDRLSDLPLLDVVAENGLQFEINLSQYLDVGLFIDHRKMRAHLLGYAHAKVCLNLFCYTGSVSVALAAGGAQKVDSIDMSRTYVSWCERNFALNRLPLEPHGFIQDDVTAWLKLEPVKQYDFIFLDPPSFSNSKRMEGTFDVERDQKWLLELCAKRLTPEGVLFFSNNKKGFRLDENGLAGFHRREITALTHSKDFAARNAHKSFVFSKRLECIEDFCRGLRQLGPEF